MIVKGLQKFVLIVFIVAGSAFCCAAEADKSSDLAWLEQYNIVWTSQSKNSGESMPCSGGDIGLNVWVENDELMFYMGRAGYRDENGALLKPGRVRIKLTPNPFENAVFLQELKLRQGYVLVTAKQPSGNDVAIKVWVEVGRPIVHLDIKSDKPVTVEATYESWRTETIELPNDRSKHARRAMCMLNYANYPGKVFLYKDEIRADKKLVRFHHRVDNSKDCFDFQVKQQNLEPVRDKLVNPLENLVWGGAFIGDNFALAGQTSGKYAECAFKGFKYVSKRPAKSHRLRACLHVDQVEKQNDWDAAMKKLIDLSPADDSRAWKENLKWWSQFWDRSRMVINSGRGEKDVGWRIGRNYQLFRYMLASNVGGRGPTLFNGGLFTFDPLYVNGKKGLGFTPDHRQWGAGLTAQNQRMVVWPLLKTGDFDMVTPGFRLYLDGLPNATARVKHYWKHDGCCYTEQTAITALPGSAVYGFFEGGGRGRPRDHEVGVQVNKAVAMIYESQLEYAWLMLRYHQFSGVDLAAYLPFIEQSVIFYDEHYRFRCKQLTGKELDDNGKLAIYPANSLEWHWNGRNPASVVAGLKRVLSELVNLPGKYTSADKKKRFKTILDRLPDIPTGTSDKFGGRYVKPSENHEHSSEHCPEMYPLYPYELYGLGLDDLELMKRTSLTTRNARFKSIAWIQANIHAPRLGDTELAKKTNSEKMDDGPYRFPAFWPHTIDWAPDHNWGGSGMIGMQEMVMQTHALAGDRGKIRLLPAWPKEWDVDFKMHAPYKTTVECKARSGKVMSLKVNPQKRKKDVILVNDRDEVKNLDDLKLPPVAKKEWVFKSFPIIAWWPPPGTKTLEDFQRYKEAGFTIYPANPDAGFDNALKLARKAGIAVMGHRTIQGFDVPRHDKPVVFDAKDSNVVGWITHDEPGWIKPAVKATTEVNGLMRSDPSRWTLFNNLPLNRPQKLPVLEIAEAALRNGMPVLSYDNYVIMEDGTDKTKEHFDNLRDARKLSLKYDVPFWAFALTTKHRAYRRPSESDVRWKQYTNLAYGAKGLWYFCYWGPHRWDDKGWDTKSIVESATGKPTELYYQVKKINETVLAMGDILLGLTSEDVMHTNPPQGHADFKFKKDKQWIADIQAKDALIGFFRNAAGQRYALVVNQLHGKGKTSKETADTIDLTFGPDVKEIHAVSWLDGKPGKLTLNGNKVSLRIGGGTGVLIKANGT